MITNGLDPILPKMSVLAAVSHGFVHEFEEFTSSHENHFSERSLSQLLGEILKPLASCRSEGWSSNYEEQVTENDRDNGNTSMNKSQSDSNVMFFSPNVLSLFLERSAFPIHSLSTPAVNHRKLHQCRVWCQEAIDSVGNPGVIASMIGVGEDFDDTDLTLSKVGYHLFPFKSVEANLLDPKEAEDTEIHLQSTNMFAFANEEEIQTNRVAHHTTVEDFRKLADILGEVRFFRLCC